MSLTHVRSRSSMMIGFSHQTDSQTRRVRMSGRRLRPPECQSGVGAHKLILTAWIGTDAPLCLLWLLFHVAAAFSYCIG